MRAALLRDPAGDRLLLAAHHLVVDAVSWQILLEDLDTAYAAISAGRPVGLAAKTTDYITLAHRLLRFVYTPSHHSTATITDLAHTTRDVLTALITHCLTPDAGAWTPSDFPLIDVDHGELDRLIEKFGRTG